MILESIGILVQGPKKSCIKATLLYGVEIRLQNKKNYSADYALFLLCTFPILWSGGLWLYNSVSYVKAMGIIL